MEFTGERIIPGDPDLKYMFLRHDVVYDFVVERTNEGAIALDLGSGEGYGATKLRSKAGKVVGCDYDIESVRHAFFKYKQPFLFFLQASGTAIPFKDKSFDLICSLQVIEHIDDDRKYIEEIHRALRGDGRVVISTPNTLTFSPPGEVGNPFHVREYEPAEFKDLLERYFGSVELYGLNIRENTAALRSIEETRALAEKISVSSDTLSRRLYRILVPSFIRHYFWKKRIAKISVLDDESKLLNDIEKEDFMITQHNLETCLDLIAICRK